MGFTAVIEKAKRFNGITPIRLSRLNFYNEWYQLHRDQLSYKDYASRFMSEELKDFKPTQEEMEFYILNENNKYDNEFASCKEVLGEVESWCSNGRTFDDYLQSLLDGYENSSSVCKNEITKEVVVNLLKWVREELDKYSFTPVTCERAFLEKYGDIYVEPSEITSIICDGIEVIDAKENIRRIYCGSLEEPELFVCRENYYYDEWAINGLKMLEETLINILSYFDFEKEMLIYSSGY